VRLLGPLTRGQGTHCADLSLPDVTRESFSLVGEVREAPDEGEHGSVYRREFALMHLSARAFVCLPTKGLSCRAAERRSDPWIAAFTFFHVAISLIAILRSCGDLRLSRRQEARRRKLLFLATTIATSVTGFFFHRDHLLPSHIVGASRFCFWSAQSWLFIRSMRAARGARMCRHCRSVYLNVCADHSVFPEGAVLTRSLRRVERAGFVRCKAWRCRLRHRGAYADAFRAPATA